MKRSSLSQSGSSLLRYAISKLSPEVFFHPIWLRFGKKEIPASLKTINELYYVVQNLQKKDPSAACQALLLCAVYHNYAGQYVVALRTTQQALALAHGTGLDKEMIWALWGGSAISYQQGNNEQAANQLSDLEAKLIERNEWVLANFVNVIKYSLQHPVAESSVEYGGTYRENQVMELLRPAFDCLRKWGYYAQSSKLDNLDTSQDPDSIYTKKLNSAHKLFRSHQWQEHWNSALRFFKGKKGRFSISALKDPMSSNPPLPNLSNPSTNQSLQLKKESMKEEAYEKVEPSIQMVVQMLGIFNISMQDTLIKLSASRGLSLFKYLLLHHNQVTPREMLMDIFWPDVDPDAARNNLNVALHTLRKELRSVTDMAVICHDNGAYCLSPYLKLWLDVDEFEKCIKTGKQLESNNQLSAAVAEYEIAINLYQGDFLSDNPYEDWTVLDRERLRVAYLDTIDHLSQAYFNQERYTACLALCQLTLNHDPCREDAHFRVMQCYSRLGQGPLALRQFQICVEALHTELEVDPAPETTQLYECIRRRGSV